MVLIGPFFGFSLRRARSAGRFAELQEKSFVWRKKDYRNISLALRIAMSYTLAVMRDPNIKCVTVTLPRALVNALERRAEEKVSSVSGVIRDYLIPIMQDRDERFNREWMLKHRGN
jgi:hypothetical protein